MLVLLNQHDNWFVAFDHGRERQSGRTIPLSQDCPVLSHIRIQHRVTRIFTTRYMSAALRGVAQHANDQRTIHVGRLRVNQNF